jgi:hypothetical protein
METILTPLASENFAAFHGGGKEESMPGGDRTGPLGLGPGTGWGRGPCFGFGAPGYRFGGRGRGFRRGFRSFGFGPFWGAPPVAPVDEASLLKNQISAMENALAEARKQLNEIEAEEK